MQVVVEFGVVYAANCMRVQAIYGDKSFSMQQRAIRSEGYVQERRPGRWQKSLSQSSAMRTKTGTGCNDEDDDTDEGVGDEGGDIVQVLLSRRSSAPSLLSSM
jgi:hypothetical protein